MRVAAAIAEILRHEGIEFLIGYPANPVIEAAAAADIRTIIVRQERTGAHMADGFSRMSSGRKIGVFAMQYGPGAESAFGGVAQAYADSAPILVLPAGYPRSEMNISPNFSSLLNYRHVTKHCEQITLAATVPRAMRRAFAQLRSGRPRPVAIEVPLDVFAEDVPEPLGYTPAVEGRSGPDPAAVSHAAELLLVAKRPIVYAGQGVHYAQAWRSLRDLVELLELPVTTSLQGKSAFPENHRLALGSGGKATPAAVTRFLGEADLVFGIGCSFTRTAYGLAIPARKTIIHSTLDPADLDHGVPADHALLGDARLVLDALLAELRERLPSGKPRAERDVSARITAVKKAWLAEWMPKLSSDEKPLSPYRVLWDLRRIVDREKTIITHDAGSPRDQLSPFWECVTPLSYIGWGKTTQLGSGLGLVMGAKLAHPDRLCINVWGDAAIGFAGLDFETAVRERIPILSILLNNSSMAIEVPGMPIATEKYRSTDISGKYADLARALGGYGERVTEPSDIVPAIRRGIKKTEAGTPVLLEFITKQELQFSGLTKSESA